jgi:hypothetical protein
MVYSTQNEAQQNAIGEDNFTNRVWHNFGVLDFIRAFRIRLC